MLGPAARKVKTHVCFSSNSVSPRRTQNLVIFEQIGKSKFKTNQNCAKMRIFKICIFKMTILKTLIFKTEHFHNEHFRKWAIWNINFWKKNIPLAKKQQFWKKKRTWKKKAGNFGPRCPEGENSRFFFPILKSPEGPKI